MTTVEGGPPYRERKRRGACTSVPLFFVYIHLSTWQCTNCLSFPSPLEMFLDCECNVRNDLIIKVEQYNGQCPMTRLNLLRDRAGKETEREKRHLTKKQSSRLVDK